ncbi:EF-hand calcium-binding domain-containing protein 11-like [Corticium candelabrum]|uniref:EF-hand calcium-binding domain-containing protein 11-like n=1 Tax=Corticium candelabrum TaxID=121492 RepID=UPI002E274868|nr:EF-hand calcium-binding domain-containing protein 11-like [Corticium candelabrum]
MERHFADPFGHKSAILKTSDVGCLDRKYMLDVFHASDSGSKGYLDAGDVTVALTGLFGYSPDEEEVGKLMNGRECLYFDDFFEAVAVRFANRDIHDEIRQIFVAMDGGCRGFLTLSDLERAMKVVAPRLEKRAVEMFREVDSDGDGRVSFRDFEVMMRIEGMS